MKALNDDLETLRRKLEERRAAIYEKYGGNPPPDDSPVVCTMCNGAEVMTTRRIDTTAGIVDSTLVPCPACSEQKVVEKRVKQIRIQSGLEGKEHLTFETVPPRPDQQHHWDDGLEYALAPRGWLVLAGGFYLGKTLLATLIANAWLEAGKMVLFRSVPAMLDELRDGYGENGEFRYRDIMQSLLDVPCLILDDYGKQKDNPWTMEKLFQITDHRLDLHLPTVVTTNVSMPELATKDRRLYMRLSDPAKCAVVAFSNRPVTEDPSFDNSFRDVL